MTKTSSFIPDICLIVCRSEPLSGFFVDNLYVRHFQCAADWGYSTFVRVRRAFGRTGAITRSNTDCRPRHPPSRAGNSASSRTESPVLIRFTRVVQARVATTSATRIARKTRRSRPTQYTLVLPQDCSGIGVSKSTSAARVGTARLKPHRLDRYMASNDPQFEEKLPILSLYT